MKNPGTWRKGAAMVLGAVALAAAAHAASVPTAPRIDLAPKSELVLHGKSTMHDFTSKATRLELAVELADGLAGSAPSVEQLSQPGAVKSVVLTIPVAGLKSAKEGLDKNMYKALKAQANPNIVFRLAAPPVQPTAGAFKVAGELEVAGQRKTIDVTLRATETPAGIVLEGSHALLMSDFGIKPPSMFLGTLKTNDRVVVEWRLVLTPNGF